VARAVTLAAAVMASAFASAAMAEPMMEAGRTSKLDVLVRGAITPNCRVSGGGEIDFGELTGGQEVRANFGLACNLPFDITFKSQSGGLAHASKPGGEGPFAGRLGYTLDVAIPTLSPAPATLGAAFDSESLMAGQTLTSGDAIAEGGGRIHIRTRRPEGAGLLAGEYSETISITVAPRA